MPPLLRETPGCGAEDHERAADADLVADLQRLAVADAAAVDVGAVGAAQVAQRPSRRLRREQLAMPAADGVVGEGQLPAVAPDQRRGIGQLKSAAFVRTLQNQKCEHG